MASLLQRTAWVMRGKLLLLLLLVALRLLLLGVLGDGWADPHPPRVWLPRADGGLPLQVTRSPVGPLVTAADPWAPASHRNGSSGGSATGRGGASVGGQ